MKQLRLEHIVATVGGPKQVVTDLRLWELNKLQGIHHWQSILKNKRMWNIINGYDLLILIHYVYLVCVFFVSGATEKHKDKCPMKGLIKGKMNFYVQETNIVLLRWNVKIKANGRKIHLKTFTSFAIYEKAIFKLSSKFKR